MVRENNKLPPGQRSEMRWHNKQLLINNQVYRKPIHPPSVHDIFKVKDEANQQIAKVNLINSEKVREKGSLFFALAHQVNNTDDVQDGYKLARMLYGEATHIVCAYRLSNTVGHKNQDCIDDGEFSAGRHMLKVLKHEKWRM